MYTREIIIQNKTGVHARPASQLVTKAGEFTSDVKVKNLKTEQETSAKSLIKILTLSLTQGTPISITAEGPDEIQAVDTLVGIVERGFGEN